MSDLMIDKGIPEDKDDVKVEEESSIPNHSLKPMNTLRALMWKNFTLKRKRRRSTCCEFSVPILFILLIIALKGLTQIENIPTGWSEDFIQRCPYTDRNATSLLVQVPCAVPYETFIFEPDNYQRFFSFLSGRDNRTPFGRFCMAHSGEEPEKEALEDFITFVEGGGTIESGPQPDFRQSVALFGEGTEEELEEYLRNPNYGLPFSEQEPECIVALVFNSIDFEKAQFTYTIRGNGTFDPVYFLVSETSLPDVEFQRNIRKIEIADYSSDGWWNLQALVDSFLIQDSFSKYTEFPMNVDPTRRKVQKEHDFFSIGKSTMIAMPINEFTRDIFFTLVQEILPLIFIIVYLMPVSQIIAVIVLEKEVRAREMMRLMGVSDFKIISSWYLTYVLFFFILALLFGLGGGSMFPATTEAAGGFSWTIFFIFFSFGMSVLAYSFVISTLFKKAFNAVVFGLMTYIILFFLFYFFNERLEVDTGPLLIPQIAFGFTVQTLAIFEETGIGVSGDLVSTNILGFNLLRGILMMLFDAFYLTVLGFYLNTVIPGEFGSAWPFYFPCLPSYWKKIFTPIQPDEEFLSADQNSIEVLSGDTIEAPNETLKSQVASRTGIQIRGMTKVFNTPDGDKVAVDKLSLDVFEGQILVLLGHNGAGKTTTLQMLTGSLLMNGGEAYIYGNRVRTDMGAIRKSLGFCPQHDVLYKELTVYDHLKFYGKVKDVTGDELEKDIDNSLQQVGLTEKKFVKSKNLSGGMKRKLSLAISLIGNSRVIFVDEPTSGVDTFSRRSMWEILQNARENRVIILTTHFMDEADLLGDRIAIMAEGKLQCVGSSFFLKQLYGAGYRLVFTKKDNCDTERLNDLILTHVSSANKASDVGTELSYQLPIDQSGNFAALFQEIDNLIESDDLQIANYGVSVTTMEEVFLKAGQSEDLLEGASNYGDKKSDVGKEVYEGATPGGVFESGLLVSFIRQFTAMLLKRVHYAKRDRYAFMCNTLVPVTIFCFGLMVLTFTDAFNDFPPIELNFENLNPDFPPDEAGFLPIVELTTADVLEFEKGRFAQQSQFPLAKLERPFVNRTEIPSGIRTLFTQTYDNGKTNNCLFPIECNEEAVSNEVGNLVLDIGDALLNPDEQFEQQIEERNGASMFGSFVVNPAPSEVDIGGCFVAEFGIDLNTGFTIGSQSVQCSDENSACVMLEVTLDNFFGNDFFTCIPAGCLSDFNEDVLNFLLGVVSQSATGEQDLDLLESLFDESSVFICNDRLCNLAPASLDDFSICRGGPAFENELCVDDRLIELSTNFTLTPERDALTSITVDIDFEAEYCRGKDVSNLDIDNFLDDPEILETSERRLQTGSATECAQSTLQDDFQALVSVQQVIDAATIAPTFSSEEGTCVDPQFECSAAVVPIADGFNICVVDSCSANPELDRISIVTELTGNVLIASLVLGPYESLDRVGCVDLALQCNQTLDFQPDLSVIGALAGAGDTLDLVLESTLIDNAIELASSLTDVIPVDIANFTAVSRNLQSSDVCAGEAVEEECTIVSLNEFCLELTCDAQLEVLGLGTADLAGVIFLFTQEGIASCDEYSSTLNCTEGVFTLGDTGIETILDIFSGSNIENLEDVFQELSSLEEEQIADLLFLLEGFNVTVDEDLVNTILEILPTAVELGIGLSQQADLLNDLFLQSLNEAELITETCQGENNHCVLIELDLNFGGICVPAGCSSSFFDNSIRQDAQDTEDAFNGITSVFTCDTDNCNDECILPSNCESQIYSPVIVVEENELLVFDEDLCQDFRIQYTFITNTSGRHMVPIGITEMHNAILRRSLVEYFDFDSEEFEGLQVTRNNNTDLFKTGDGGKFGDPTVGFEFPDPSQAPKITVITHPLPFTQATQEIFEAIIAFTTAIFCLLAYAFIPAPMVAYVVMEKEEDVQVKHLQFVSGAGVFAYWTSNYAFDLISFLVPFFLSLFLILLFDVNTFIDNGAFQVVAIVLFGYGFAIIPFSYLVGHLFRKHTSALIWIIIINCILGLTLMVASFAMDQVPETRDVNQDLKWLYRISPGFCLGDSLLNIAITTLTIGLLGEEEAPGFYDRDVTGANIAYLYLEAIVYFLLVVFIEYSKTTPILAKYLNIRYIKGLFSSKQSTQNTEDDIEIDEDVQREADRVLELAKVKELSGDSGIEGGVKEEVLQMHNLRKVYGNGKVAVKGVSLGIPEGECFGYLGINGAGKTTTLKCLTGDIFPTSGNGFISGYSIVSEQWTVRKHIGYCSQFSSILGLLTVREHLELFCRIKQIVDVEGTVQKLLARLSLTPFENKLSKSLSGGNKRKLSVGIAMIGSPAVMLLDEPSTGMDVASRRFMWNVIENMVAGKYDGKKTSVILTTHSMEECEALCSRVGIMVGGRLRCLGSIQHLKSRFGTGYTLEAKVQFVSKEQVLEAINNAELEKDMFVNNTNLDEVLDKLEEKDAVERLRTNPNGIAWNILSKLKNDGCQINVLIEWILQQYRIIELQSFLTETFVTVELVELHDYQVTYRIEKSDNVRLSTIFAAIEENKEGLRVSEYSVSQTTLEQIFNGFAAQQEEEQRKPRGVA